MTALKEQIAQHVSTNAVVLAQRRIVVQRGNPGRGRQLEHLDRGCAESTAGVAQHLHEDPVLSHRMRALADPVSHHQGIHDPLELPRQLLPLLR